MAGQTALHGMDVTRIIGFSVPSQYDKAVQRPAVFSGMDACILYVVSMLVEIPTDGREQIGLVLCKDQNLQGFATTYDSRTDHHFSRGPYGKHILRMPGHFVGLMPQEIFDIQDVPKPDVLVIIKVEGTYFFCSLFFALAQD